MSQLSAKLRSVSFGDRGSGIGFWCPGCCEMHHVRTAGPTPGWAFNGDLLVPTVTPSILVTGKQTVKDEHGNWTGEWVLGQDGKAIDAVCHSFLTAGELHFLGDCTHALAGKVVPLPDLPEGLTDE